MAARPRASALTGGLGCGVTVRPPVERRCDKGERDYGDYPEQAAIWPDLRVAPCMDRKEEHLRQEHGNQQLKPVRHEERCLRYRRRRTRRVIRRGHYDNGASNRQECGYSPRNRAAHIPQ